MAPGKGKEIRLVLFWVGMMFLGLALILVIHYRPLEQELPEPGLIRLEGKWKVSEQDKVNFRFFNYDDVGWRETSLPAGRKESLRSEKSQVVWFRKRFYVPSRSKIGGVKFKGVALGEISVADKTYFNGSLIGATGELSGDAAMNHNFRRLYQVPEKYIRYDSWNVLALQVRARAGEYVGPYYGALVFGEYQRLMEERSRDHFTGMLYGSLFVMAGLFFLFLHRFNRSETEVFYSGLVLMTAGLYLFVTDRVFYEREHFFLIKRTQYFLAYLLPPLFFRFFYFLTLFKRKSSFKSYVDWFSRFVFLFPFAALPVLLFYQDINIWEDFNRFYNEYLIQVLCLGAMGILTVQIFQKRLDAFILFVGVGFFCISVLLDMYIRTLAYAGQQNFLGVGLSALLLSVMLIQVKKLFLLYQKNRSQFIGMKVLSNNHRAMVKLRTVHLETAQRELLAANTRLKQLIRVDAMTGLLNRRAFLEFADREQSKFDRYQREFSLILMDIDNFKQLNDRYGHECGDIIIRETAETIQAGIRKQDVVCRWGGEEYILLLPETNQGGAISLAEKIREQISEMLILYEGERLYVTATLGISVYDRKMTLDECIKAAGMAMYEGKHQTKNCVRYRSASM